MSEHGEIQPRPVDQPQARPEMVVAPKNPIHEGRLRLPTDERAIRDLPLIRSQEQWNRMTVFDINLAIEHGKITDPRALLVLATKEREDELLVRGGEKLHAETEARYKPLMEGNKQALVQYCQDKAQPHLDYCRDRAKVDIEYHRAHPDQTMFKVSDSIRAGAEHERSASFWQELASEVNESQEATIKPQSDTEAKQKWEESPFTNELLGLSTVRSLREHSTQPDALSRLQHLNANSLQTLTDTLEQVKVKEALQAEGEPTPAKNDLIDLLLALIQGVKDGSISAAKHVLSESQQDTR